MFVQQTRTHRATLPLHHNLRDQRRASAQRQRRSSSSPTPVTSPVGFLATNTPRITPYKPAFFSRHFHTIVFYFRSVFALYGQGHYLYFVLIIHSTVTQTTDPFRNSTAPGFHPSTTPQPCPRCRTGDRDRKLKLPCKMKCVRSVLLTACQKSLNLPSFIQQCGQKPKFIEPGGSRHPYCSRSCAKQAQGANPSACALRGCRATGKPPFSNFCSDKHGRRVCFV